MIVFHLLRPSTVIPADGSIDDGAYINSIQYLVEQDIIVIPIPETSITQTELDELKEAHQTELDVQKIEYQDMISKHAKTAAQLQADLDAQKTKYQNAITKQTNAIKALEAELDEVRNKYHKLLKKQQPAQQPAPTPQPSPQAVPITIGEVTCDQPTFGDTKSDYVEIEASIKNIGTTTLDIKYRVYITDRNGEKLASNEGRIYNLPSEETRYTSDYIRYKDMWHSCGIQITDY